MLESKYAIDIECGISNCQSISEVIKFLRLGLDDSGNPMGMISANRNTDSHAIANTVAQVFRQNLSLNYITKRYGLRSHVSRLKRNCTNTPRPEGGQDDCN